MKLFKKIPLSFEGKDYEIRVLYDESTINVVAFHNNHPANGYRHQIKLPKKCSLDQLLNQNIASELIELSRRDITEKRWEAIAQTVATATV